MTRLVCGFMVVSPMAVVHQMGASPPAYGVTCAEVVNIGHRGAGQGPNENTIPHLTRAARDGVDAVEFDVRRTRDGVLGVMHDRTVNRTTNGRGKVASHRWSRFRSLRTSAGHHPPSLPMVIRAMAPLQVGLQIHLKVDLSASRLATTRRQLVSHGFGPGAVQFNSDNLRLLGRVRRVTGFPTGYTYIGRPSATRLKRVARTTTDVAVLQRHYLSARWVSFAAARGLELGARAETISPDWAVQVGVRRLVVDRPQFRCSDPDIEPPPPTPTDPVETTPTDPVETTPTQPVEPTPTEPLEPTPTA